MRELALHVLDLIQNSLAAGASRISICIREDVCKNTFHLSVADDGRGMTPDACRDALDPFYTSRTIRSVGLGLPLLAAAAERAGGVVAIQSAPGQGTVVTATFQHDHLDRAPLGDMAATLTSAIALNEHCEFRYFHQRGDKAFTLDTAALRRQLKGIPLSHPRIAGWLRQHIAENESLLEV